MPENQVILILVSIVAVILTALTALELSVSRGRTDLAEVDDADRGPPRHPPEVRYVAESGDQRERLSRIFEATQLLRLDHLRGMDVIEEQLRELAAAVRTATRSPRRRPRSPASILLHGPPGGAMTVFTHELARTFRAKLVQLCSSAALPSTDGGSQPAIAAVVNQARYHLPSVLVIDQFEAVASAAIRDADRHRAANDLLGEALRPIYGASHVVVAVFTAYDDDRVSPAIRNRFEHVVPLDAPRLERALRIYALRTADPELYRAISGARLAEHPDLSPPTWGSAA